jgi:8-oxo-dGDP phosphatase
MGIEEDLQAVIHRQVVPFNNKIDVEADAHSLSDFVPKTKVNMCYICGTVLFNDSGQVLLIQEAKKSCLGTWYLPAGRLEPGETIIDGAKREVKEEAGIECDLTTLLSVEINGYRWVRFTFLGKITGGKLKTENEKDKESLQAKFFSKEDLLQSQTLLRHHDILKLIELGRKYIEVDPTLNSSTTLPVIAPHSKLIHRVVIIDNSTTSDQAIHLLVNKDGENHIPTALMNHTKEASIAVSVYAILRDAFTTSLSAVSVRMCGVLGVEHSGTGTDQDGICVTTLVSLDLVKGIPPPSVASQRYHWYAIQHADLRERLKEAAQGKIVPLL